ncbi:hypothetical protein ASD56_04270 [Microbacterium sp. Root166]|uniref:DUF4166 domain-containing protein n=1 Tax=Microbacterium sp. Root166 TaxID=1736478 RepID=UPI0006FA2AC9|nr:DUF4166 domain-containing protein [Microbacterium sp. Root166]KQZ85541.1 hypothetical protein ASD56_04270 [Microbacterium sp. Root166]
MAVPAPSVYQRVLGDEFSRLDPRLQRYFGPLAPGEAGVGTGVYEEAGSRIRMLRPLLSVMARRNVLFPEYGHGVPFTVVNSAAADGTLSAVRTFAFGERVRIMEDTMEVAGGALVDRLGKRRGLEVGIRLSVIDGGLRMRSTRLALWIGRLRLPLPRLAVMHLDERMDPAGAARQCVDVRITAPLLGEVFRYAGAFTYERRPSAFTGSPRPPRPGQE